VTVTATSEPCPCRRARPWRWQRSCRAAWPGEPRHRQRNHREIRARS